MLADSVARLGAGSRDSCALNGAQDAGGKGEDGGDEFEDPADYKADEAEGEQDKPDERVEDQREERGWPADDEKD